MVVIPQELRGKVSPELLREIEGGSPKRVRVNVELNATPSGAQVSQLQSIFASEFGMQITFISTSSPFIAGIVDEDKIAHIAAQPWVRRVWHVAEVGLL